MGTTADKLQKVLSSKESIRQAIINKGVNVSPTDTFSSLLKDILESYDDGQFLVSRELTRRMKDFEDMGRAGKFNA